MLQHEKSMNQNGDYCEGLTSWQRRMIKEERGDEGTQRDMMEYQCVRLCGQGKPNETVQCSVAGC